MRAAAILGLGSSLRDLAPFQRQQPVEWIVGLPPDRQALDAILLFGGDGTVHRHLGALVELRVPVLVVPTGSGNDFARALGLHRVRDSLAAWRRFVSGSTNVRAIDLGTIAPLKESNSWPEATSAEPVHFACAAGVGLDGEIARRANALPRWLRAHGGYALSLPAALLSFQPFSLTLSVTRSGASGEVLRNQQSVVVVFANTPFYGGGMRIAPRATMDDSQLDVCVIRDIPKIKLLSVFPTVYFGRHLGVCEVDYFQAAGARVRTDRPLPVYADGELVCSTPVAIGVVPGALTVVVP